MDQSILLAVKKVYCHKPLLVIEDYDRDCDREANKNKLFRSCFVARR